MVREIDVQQDGARHGTLRPPPARRWPSASRRIEIPVRAPGPAGWRRSAGRPPRRGCAGRRASAARGRPPSRSGLRAAAAAGADGGAGRRCGRLRAPPTAARGRRRPGLGACRVHERQRQREHAALAGALCTVMSPPSSRARSREIESPRPVPPYLRCVLPSACRKASKIAACWCAGMPMPVSRTANDTVRSDSDEHAQRDLPRLRELQRIREEVLENLPEPLGVGFHPFRRARFHGHAETEPLLLRDRLEGLDEGRRPSVE